MKKVVLLFLAPLIIISQNYEYEPKKKITDYEYSPLWTVYDGGERDQVYYIIFLEIIILDFHILKFI